jgi:hypothetical protein
MFALLLWWVLGCGSAALPCRVELPADRAIAPACARCNDAGVIECPSCAKSTCTWGGEGRVQALFCTKAAACRECAGTRRIDCPACERPMPAELVQRRADGEAWLARMREIDAKLEGELLHAESAHFTITWNLRRLDFDPKEGVSTGGDPSHGAMHVYLDRMEALYADFLRDLSATDRDFCAKTHLMVWQKEHDQEIASLAYTGQASSTESKLMGRAPVVSIFYDKGNLHEEFELHQACVHQVTHCLLSNVFDGIWPGNIRGGWIDCGLAHAYEIRYFGSVRHYCYVEADTLQNFKFGRWEQAVLSGVLAGDERPFLGVTGRNTTELTPEEHMYAWSYCDFLLRKHGAKFGAVAKGVKAKKQVGEILQQELGLTPGQFQESWKSWVKETYSPKKKRN